MKIVIDMNLSPRWCEVLRVAGFDAEHWSALGPATAPDREIMAYALTDGMVVLTHDLDFSAILAATGAEKPSVVQLRAADTHPEVVGPMVVAAVKQMQVDLERGALLTIDLQRTRMRVLPLR